MQLFKYLNRTIYILFTACVFLLLFSNQVQAISITSNTNFAVPGQQVVFTSVVQVTGASADILNVFVDYGDGTSEDHIYNADPYSPRTLSILSNHTYSKPGTYTVRLRATVGGAITIVGPNPVFIRQTVGRLTISRIQLYFENNRPEITIKRNQKPPTLSVRIDYSGSGYLKGHWEIDGKRRGYVFKHLNNGPSVILKYPDIPPLPTFQFGTHNVRFVITDPAMNIKFPYAIYFVTSDEKKAFASIPLIQPVDGEDITYGSLTFKWKPINKNSVYLISIFSTTKEERIFAAYTRQGEYALRPDILKARMQPGEKYIWSVIGFNDQNEVTAESIPFAFSFNQETAFLPGQILLITEPNDQGQKIVREVKEKYGFLILQTYSIKTLGLQVTIFHTDKEMFRIISELQQRKGVVTVQPNYIFKTMSEPADEPMNELQSIRKTIQIEPDIPFKGKGVIVAIIDTGVDINHQDLSGAILSHANCLSNSKYLPEIHGTAVAGLIGARTNNLGIDGYAPESKIVALRACKQISNTQPRGECYSLSIAKALDLAIQQGANVINMSLGTNVEDQLISKLIDAGSEQGILFVAPSGNNSAIYELCFPASHPDVISVAGITEKGEFFPNSKVAEKSDFYLPYDNFFSTIPNNKYNFLSGTSLSSAVVSGLLALAHEKNKDMITKRLPFFDGDINQWVNKYLTSKNIATQEKN